MKKLLAAVLLLSAVSFAASQKHDDSSLPKATMNHVVRPVHKHVIVPVFHFVKWLF